MKRNNLFKSIAGISAASAMLLSLTADTLPLRESLYGSIPAVVKAAASNPDECDYVFEVDSEIGGIIVNEETGEMGAMNKDNAKDRSEWAEFYISTAKSFGM